MKFNAFYNTRRIAETSSSGKVLGLYLMGLDIQIVAQT
jgi:hypothetical protein